MSVKLVVIGTIVAIVPFFTLLLFKALMLLAPIFNLATCTSTTDDIMQISVILISPLVKFPLVE
jgi:hypothetical protein